MKLPLHIETPLLQSSKIVISGARVWLKMDALQPAGSFKNRGIGHACQHYVDQGASRLISSSGGNAGIAVAYSGYMLNVPVNVVVPENAPETAIAAMRQFNADVEVKGSSWLEAHSRAMQLVDDSSVLIHPFDDPILWPGHATLIDEVVNAGCRPDAVVLSVGGGGLLCGVAQGLSQNNLDDCQIIAVETEGAASLSAAIRAGGPTMLDEISTVANTLGAKQVSMAAYQVTQNYNVISHIVSDRQALDSCKAFLNDHRILVEPACGAALSAVYTPAADLKDKIDILVVVCGGMGISREQLDHWDKTIA